MVERHISSRFENELLEIKASIARMGALVEDQIRAAIHALSFKDDASLQKVLETEQQVNHLEVEMDRKLSDIISRRQPTASDLRLLLAISKISTNLERTGDETVRVARMMANIAKGSEPSSSLPFENLSHAADLASNLLHKSLDAFAALDVGAAIAILKEDSEIDAEYGAFVSKLIERLKDEPAIISSGFSLLFLAKALERIGDHSKNIAEVVIYAARGIDVRHLSLNEIGLLIQADA